jgi:hypothetical protein
VTECEDPEENMYEVGRLMAALKSDSGASLPGVLRFIAGDLEKFARGRELLDDRTLLLMSVEP